jgi:hypothetical protein
VHCEIGFAADDDSLDFTDEKALSAHLCEGAILDAIALGLDVNLLDVELWEMGLELFSNPARLDERQIAGACCNS